MANYKAGNATVVTQEFIPTTTVTNTSTSYVDVTGFTLTLSSNAGKTLIIITINWSSSTAASTNGFKIVDASTSIGGQIVNYHVAGHWQQTILFHIADNDGQAIKLQTKTSAGTQSIYGTTNDADTASSIKSYQIS